eukprot:NODE_47_length_32105_cov_1.240892.p23 type:complete len:160 gc:universal NODE_47_length_32105_cov_1.240892:14495-14974(+)
MRVWIQKFERSILSCEIYFIPEPYLATPLCERVIPESFSIYYMLENQLLSMEFNNYGNLIKLFENEPQMYAFIGANTRFDSDSDAVQNENMVYIITKVNEYYAIPTRNWMNHAFKIEGHLLSGNENAIKKSPKKITATQVNPEYINLAKFATYLHHWKH